MTDARRSFTACDDASYLWGCGGVGVGGGWVNTATPRQRGFRMERQSAVKRACSTHIRDADSLLRHTRT